MSALRFQKAASPAEFGQIHRLNHRTFAEEIRQHVPTADGLLVDSKHEWNTYFTATQHGELLGMIAVHDRPPFSVAKRLRNPEALAALGKSPLEVRLLAIEPHVRHRTILAGLLWQVYSHARSNGHSHILISGIEDKAEMYHSLGFEDFGPAVGDGDAAYIPMVLQLEDAPGIFTRKALRFEKWWKRLHSEEPVSLMPGPVQVAPQVRAAFTRTPISHRCSEFLDIYQGARKSLSSLSRGLHVAIVTGSGSLANDIVAANLKAAFDQAPGLVIANGEFGERLIRHAARAGLCFKSIAGQWGQPWNLEQIASRLTHRPAWMWAVHLETSTGVLNDLAQLCDLARYHGVRLAADCVSSLGSVPLADYDLFLASGVSGKAIGAYAGLAIVFASDDALQLVAKRSLPPVFEIASSISSVEPPSTVPSPQMLALGAALDLYYAESSRGQRFDHYRILGKWLRQQLREHAIQPLAPEAHAAPTIVTFTTPSAQFVEQTRVRGFTVAYESGYLRSRNWAQISIMGDLRRDKLDALFAGSDASQLHAGAFLFERPALTLNGAASVLTL